jgi:transaldolase
MTDPLAALRAAGVSIWLDDLSRERLTSGSLAELVAHHHVTGVTTNPTIFAKAISDGDAYAAQLADLSARGVSVGEALRALTTFDVRSACDVLRPVYDATNGWTGGCPSRWTRGWRTTRRPRSPRPARCGGP